MEYRGENVGNAECVIDYVEKTVKIIPVGRLQGEKEIYFTHTIPVLFSLIIAGSLLGSILLWWISETFNSSIADSVRIMKVIAGVYFAMIFLTTFLGTWYILGWVSIHIHRRSKWARDNLPRTNAFLNFLNKTQKIDLTKKAAKEWIKYDNKLIITNQSVVSFQYEYEGTNTLEKVETVASKFTKDNVMSSCHVIFTFKEPITGGVLKWK